MARHERRQQQGVFALVPSAAAVMPFLVWCTLRAGGPLRTARGLQRLGGLHARLLRSSPEVDELVTRARRWERMTPSPIRCLESALHLWYVLNLHGHPARVRIGAKNFPLVAHAWVELGRRTFGALPDRKDMRTLATLEAWGRSPSFTTARPRWARALPASAACVRSAAGLMLFSLETGRFLGANAAGQELAVQLLAGGGRAPSGRKKAARKPSWSPHDAHAFAEALRKEGLLRAVGAHGA